jgi:hypothetical protein
MLVLIFAQVIPLSVQAQNMTSTYFLSEGTYLRYGFVKKVNFHFPQWSGDLWISGTDEYVVISSRTNTIVIEENLWGVVSWPKGAVLTQTRYIGANFTSKYNTTGDTFAFTNSLHFVKGVLTHIEMDGIYEIVFYAQNPRIAINVILGTLYNLENPTALFLFSTPKLNTSINILGGIFNVVSINSSLPQFAPRKLLVGTTIISKDEASLSSKAYWDAETGILMRFEYIISRSKENSIEYSLWELKNTNLFLVPHNRIEPRRLEFNVTYIIEESLEVTSISTITFSDIVESTTIAFKFRQEYEPFDFTAFDLRTKTKLRLETEYEAPYVIVRIYFPETIREGQLYSFTLVNKFKKMVVKIGEWYQFSANFIAYGIPTYYTFTLKFPLDWKWNIVQSFIRRRYGDVILEPKVSLDIKEHFLIFYYGDFIFHHETIYMTGNDQFNFIINIKPSVPIRRFLITIGISSFPALFAGLIVLLVYKKKMLTLVEVIRQQYLAWLPKKFFPSVFSAICVLVTFLIFLLWLDCEVFNLVYQPISIIIGILAFPSFIISFLYILYLYRKTRLEVKHNNHKASSISQHNFV